MYVHKLRRKPIILILLLTLVMQLILPVAAGAQEKDRKVVRVGWFDSSYCFWDQYGERRGIAYEYQRKIAAHTGWTYEYVEDSWPNLLQMLIDGKIDLMSDVSYTEERAGLMLFPSLTMGAESYYIYIDADNTEVTSEDLQTLTGKRIGVNKGSFQAGILQDWVKKNNLSIEMVELTVDEPESMRMLSDGEIDAYVSMNSFGSQERIVPVCKIGSSDYYFAVSKERPDLLAELNNALSSIQDEDPYYNQRVSDEQIRLTKTNAYLPANLEDWLEEHGTIRVGYRDDYLPFCGTDKTTGDLTGALKDYLTYASNCLKKAQIKFEPVAYAGTGAAIEAVKTGEIDCAFPINLTTYQGELIGLQTVNPIMKTEMSLLMKAEGRPELTPGKQLTIAIDEGNINFENFVRYTFPEWTIRYYPTEIDCFRAVSSAEADGVLAPNYRMGEYEPLREKYKLVDLPTGEMMGFSFAVNSDNSELYAILNKIANLSSDEDMEVELASYMYLNRKVSVLDFLKDNWALVLAAISVAFFVILFLLYQKLKAERKANEQQRLLEEAGEIVKLKETISSLLNNMPGMNYTKDAQSGVYLACNQDFASYAHKQSPEDVIGCTDQQLFDAETARRMAEDDRVALSMEEPYIFFEDYTDHSGDRRHIKTTKLKYTDDGGRLCVLGISLDATSDMVRIHRGTAASKEDYEKARISGIIYTHIAQALARGYTDLYYINLKTEEFTEYRTDQESGSLTEVRHGWHFFEECEEEAEDLIYAEDREAFVEAMDRQTLETALERNNTFMMNCRALKNGEPIYVNMTVTRMQDDENFIILGVTDVDEQMKQRYATARIKEEQIAYNRLSALAGDFLHVFIVEPKTGRYRELSAVGNMRRDEKAREGTDFFNDIRSQSRKEIFKEDQNLFLTVFTKENVMADVIEHGLFTFSYRIPVDGKPRYVMLKIVMLEEQEGRRLVAGINDIDTQIRQEEDYTRHLTQARLDANVDALTGVKNRHAFLVAEERLNARLAEERAARFAIVILDVNDLKVINDAEGHKAGDQYLKDACRIICNIFKHSPVFRVGGDEFVVISRGEDYEHIEELVAAMRDHNEEALQNGGIIIACGMARHEDEETVAPVFERADERMYENKSDLKNRRRK